MNHSISY